jgi:integrase
MATVKFLLQSKSDNSNIYIRYSINRATVLKRKTGLVINPKDWSTDKSMPKTGRDDLKIIKSKLDKLAVFINEAYNDGISKAIEFDGEWLQLQIDFFNKKVVVVELDILTNYIDKYITDAPYKTNQKKEVGLSAGRIGNMKLFKNTISRYEDEVMGGKKILIKNINLQFVEKYKTWLFNQNYAVNYVGKNIDNIKTICNDAFKNDIETSPQLKNIRSISESNAPENIIYLSEDEQELIKNTTLKREALINARKWLLLGCLIGQRGGDLLDITEDNIREINGHKIIELTQQKTGKMVAIPVLPGALQIIESGMPYNISLPKFNEYIKDVCEIAGINKPTIGKKRIKANSPTVKNTYPKYKLITSHVCRKSFATNFYGRIPTPVLMHITAHGTEIVFRAYIGKTTYENAYQMLDYFSKLPQKL